MQPIRPPNSRFAASLKEVEPGQIFELTIDGTPPFPPGYSNASVVFKTNIPDQPNYGVALSAYVAPRIEIIPKKIVADNTSKNIKNRTIRITNNGTTPLKVTSVSVSDPNYKVRLKPPDTAQPKETIVIGVVLPEGDYRPPPWGEVIRIATTDAEKPLIELNVLPHLRRPPTKRPLDVPLKFHPGEMP